jgi:hypothetical protein
VTSYDYEEHIHADTKRELDEAIREYLDSMSAGFTWERNAYMRYSDGSYSCSLFITLEHP